MKKLLILTVLTVCLTLNAKTTLAGCGTISSGIECTVEENEYAEDTWYQEGSSYTHLKAWATITADGAYAYNNVTVMAYYWATGGSPWPSYMTGYWAVLISNNDSSTNLQTNGGYVETNQYDNSRVSWYITLQASSTYTPTASGNLCRGGISMDW